MIMEELVTNFHLLRAANFKGYSEANQIDLSPTNYATRIWTQPRFCLRRESCTLQKIEEWAIQDLNL